MLLHITGAAYRTIVVLTFSLALANGPTLEAPAAWASGAAGQIEASLERATAWRTRSKLGRIRADGTLRLGPAATDHANIVATITDGQDLNETGQFTSCRTYRSGTIRCQNDDRSTRIRYIPIEETPGLFRYKLDVRRRDIQQPQVAPLQIRFDHGALASAAKNEPCTALQSKLVCRGSSVPVCLPSPEVCGDGIDNDCDGLVDDQDDECGCPCFDEADVLSLATRHAAYGSLCSFYTLTSGHPGAQLNSGYVPSFSNSCSSSIVRWFAWSTGWRADGGGSCRIMDVWNCSDDSGERTVDPAQNLSCQNVLAAAAAALCP